ncbi:MAG TPA: glycoside hydrolase family 27 protein, partial [Solirubrobacteraceae bacterium]
MALAPTPPMGWNPWYQFGCKVDEQLIEQTAQAMSSSGMAAAGYRYVNLDDCWEADSRDANGALQADPETFPDGI